MAYYISTANEVKQISAEFYADWVAKNNPKAQEYTLIPDPTTPYDYWNGTEWITPAPHNTSEEG